MTKKEYEKLSSHTTYTFKDRLKLYYKGALYLFINVIILFLIILALGIASVNIVMFFTKDPYAIIGFTLLLSICLAVLIAPFYIIGTEAFSKKFWGDELW